MESISFQTPSDAPNVGASPADDRSAPQPAAARTEASRASRQGQRIAAMEKRLLGRMLKSIGAPSIGVVLWDGDEVTAATRHEADWPRIHIHDRATLWKIVLDPSFQFPDAYSDGRADVEGNLEDLLCRLGASFSASGPANGGLLSRLETRLRQPRRNTLAGSRENIHHHYDIGNDFYRLWLDENLVYTCAYFEEPTASLEQAQYAKMDHVCRKLMLRPGETVIEAGCGWGALALHMARNYGVRVRAYNISREQIAEARRLAQAEGLQDRAEFILDDWRNIRGECDAFVSVGMLEHVGTANYRELGDVIDGCLAPGGRGLIHTIGRNRPQPLDPWIERRIFPGAYPPALSQMAPIFEPHELSILDVENLRLHYAETLRHWLARFEQSVDAVQRMYDARFVRMWRMYLAGSIAAFVTGSLQLFQVVFARPFHNRLPLTREHQYAHLVDGQPQACRSKEDEPADARRTATGKPAFWDER